MTGGAGVCPLTGLAVPRTGRAGKPSVYSSPEARRVWAALEVLRAELPGLELSPEAAARLRSEMFGLVNLHRCAPSGRYSRGASRPAGPANDYEYVIPERVRRWVARWERRAAFWADGTVPWGPLMARRCEQRAEALRLAVAGAAS